MIGKPEMRLRVDGAMAVTNLPTHPTRWNSTTRQVAAQLQRNSMRLLTSSRKRYLTYLREVELNVRRS